MAHTTHTKAEKARIREASEKRRAAKEDKVFYTLLIITAVVVAAVFLALYIKDAVTLPVEIRNTAKIEDNWLVIDVDNTVSKRYHHPASFDIPAGYVQGEMVMESTGESQPFTKYNDGVCRDFYLVPEDAAAQVAVLYVDAAPELTAADYVQRYIDMYANTQDETTTIVPGTPFTAEIAGETAQCLYLRYSTAEGDYGVLLCAFDAPRNVCVNAMLSGVYTTPENVQTQEQLLAEAEVLLAGLTIVR